MRIFSLGAGGTGSLLAQLLVRQGHTVWCGDRDVERARRFLGKKSEIEIREADAPEICGPSSARRAALQPAHQRVARRLQRNHSARRAASRRALHGFEFASESQPVQAGAISIPPAICRKESAPLLNLRGRGAGAYESARKARVELARFRQIQSTSSPITKALRRAKIRISAWSPKRPTTRRFRCPAFIATGILNSARRFDEREKISTFPPALGETPVYTLARRMRSACLTRLRNSRT